MNSYVRLKKPCSNCPFRDDGKAIDLKEGRLDGIISDLMSDDWASFYCHKTVHSKKGGHFDDDGSYHDSGNEAMCAGAMGYLHKKSSINVPMRLAILSGDLSREELDLMASLVID